MYQLRISAQRPAILKITVFWDTAPFRLHGAISRKAVIFILAAVRT
jgi:hypothetical protein